VPVLIGFLQSQLDRKLGSRPGRDQARIPGSKDPPGIGTARRDWLPGEQIPSLDDLSKSHGVSRVTARKAVLLLIDEGLLETRPRWGTFVTEP
jgi:hypothetical protein